MNVKIFVTTNFKRRAKKYLKKYKSLKDELKELQGQLEENPQLGTMIMEDVYKVWLASKSKGKGKSGGFRIINYLEELSEEEKTTFVNMLTIYDKSETESLKDAEVQNLIEELEDEKED